ncbi:PHP domain-containing protein [Arthrobacter sp. HY1533]|uniref:PHP domain-containing protein n=1 Tax=Arthrobacter sp. HY1533 TaxID=2970919 RepID=UPI0022B9F318|nr:PHP domain-containing protein [Arthrobacter sp. HY1533]
MCTSNTPMTVSRRQLMAAAALAAAGMVAGTAALPTRANAAGKVDDRADLAWLVGDHHVHTVYSHDAKYTQGHLLEKAAEFGVDVIAFTEHSNWGHANMGGALNSQREIAAARAARPDMLIFQGLEWYIPAAEHASVLVAPGPNEARILRQFELLWDGKLNGWEKPAAGSNQAAEWEPKAGQAIAWLAAQKQSGFIDDVVVLANHPSRLGIDSPHEMRNWRDAAPDIVIGMEGAPGAQASAVSTFANGSSQRGEYENAPSEFSFPGFPAEAYKTRGGFDWVTAVVGGLWDSMLAEGKPFWITSNSDNHLTARDTMRIGDYPAGDGWDNGASLKNFNRAGRRPDPVEAGTPQNGSDFWPGQFSRTHIGADSRDYLAVMAAMRAGRMWVDHGHLIDGLDVRVRQSGHTGPGLAMGSTLSVAPGSDVELVITVKTASKANPNGTVPELAHVDIIKGLVTGPVADRDGFTTPNTRVHERIETNGRTGELVFTRTFSNVIEPFYLRLRGSDGKRSGVGPLGAAVDPQGPIPHGAGEGDPWADTWFYANPVFIDVAAQ